MSTESENGILETYRIDPALTRKILDAWNRSDPSTRSSPIKAAGIPGIDGTTVIDRNSRSFLLPAEAVRKGIS